MTFVWIALALTVLEAAFVLWCVVEERPLSGFFSAALVLFAVSWMLGWNLWALVVANPLWIVCGIVGYLVAGVGWSFPKWWFYVRKIRDIYLEARSRAKITKESSEQDVKDFLYYNKHLWDEQSIPPLASENKNRILIWMMYWPFSLLWTIIDEPIKKAFQFIFEQFKGVYQRISESAFAGVN